MTSRASLMGLAMPRTADTAPVDRSFPSMMLASISTSPFTFSTDPWPETKRLRVRVKRLVGLSMFLQSVPCNSSSASLPEGNLNLERGREAGGRRWESHARARRLGLHLSLPHGQQEPRDSGHHLPLPPQTQWQGIGRVCRAAGTWTCTYSRGLTHCTTTPAPKIFFFRLII